MLPRLPVCLLISLPVLLVQGSSSIKGSAPASPPPTPSPFGDPTWALGLKLYQSLRSDVSSVNTLFSPLLVASSLGALGTGASGTTASEFQDLLGVSSFAKHSSQTRELLSSALNSFVVSNLTSFHLHTSSAVFSKLVPAVSPAFVKDSKAKFRLQHQPLGKGDSKADLELLQGWVKEGLDGLEGAPLEGEIKAGAGALILVNAVHFKGLWEREFSDDSKDSRIFLGKKYTKVMMMHRAGFYRLYEDVANMVQVLEVPLWGGKASLVLLLPFHVEDLARLDKLLTLELLSKWLENANSTSVAVSLPKANITSTVSLQKHLLALGLTDAWDPKVADFSGVSAGGKGVLHLGNVLHWASMELAAHSGKEEADLEEENIEKPRLFYADHPFIILVKDNVTGALLLMGALDHVEGEPLHDEL
ncbi:serine (or cysteine) peptidase inhibitor, clade H, member 2 [Cynoglossus semilaevis]|uniref:Serine (or cysteine) peptidase inhibitor, clade H, member 2 n=1 Tax=Cynoglossus semilaevis TaxID=244447 RepID=A0A3P8VTR4_CYNSE|nr:serpin H1-like [Cynoglossus semilaevis]